MTKELNERVHIEIFGWQPETDPTWLAFWKYWKPRESAGLPPFFTSNDAPDYSGNIADAWRVVKELANRLIWLAGLEESTPVSWFASFRYWWPGNDAVQAHWKAACSGSCESAPLAICLAALDICAKLREEK